MWGHAGRGGWARAATAALVGRGRLAGVGACCAAVARRVGTQHQPAAAARAAPQDTVGELKERLSGVIDVAPNKLKLNREGVGFLTDALSLAHYNVGPDTTLVLATKERARKK